MERTPTKYAAKVLKKNDIRNTPPYFPTLCLSIRNISAQIPLFLRYLIYGNDTAKRRQRHGNEIIVFAVFTTQSAPISRRGRGRPTRGHFDAQMYGNDTSRVVIVSFDYLYVLYNDATHLGDDASRVVIVSSELPIYCFMSFCWYLNAFFRIFPLLHYYFDAVASASLHVHSVISHIFMLYSVLFSNFLPHWGTYCFLRRRCMRPQRSLPHCRVLQNGGGTSA